MSSELLKEEAEDGNTLEVETNCVVDAESDTTVEPESGHVIEIETSNAWPAKLSLMNVQWASADKDVLSFQLNWGDTLSAKRTVSTFEASTIVEGLIAHVSDVELGIDKIWVTWVKPAVGAKCVSLNVKGTLVFPLVLNGNFDYCVEVELG